MLRELRKMKNKSNQRRLRMLQYRGKLPVHVNDKGYLCYDTEELKRYTATSKRGRPLKIKGEQ